MWVICPWRVVDLTSGKKASVSMKFGREEEQNQEHFEHCGMLGLVVRRPYPSFWSESCYSILLIQFPVNMSGRQKAPCSYASSTDMGDPKGVPGFWSTPGFILFVNGFWKVNQWMEDICLFLFPFPSFHLDKSLPKNLTRSHSSRHQWIDRVHSSPLALHNCKLYLT